VGVTHDDLVPLFLVTLPLQTRGKLSDLVVFVGTRVLEVWSRDLRIPMTESISLEHVHEVAQSSPKFRCNPLGESGDRVLQS
jgi:hypothetical protein